MSNNIKLAYILGAGHCGSTLLSLLLNGHTEILALNEIQTIKWHAAHLDELADDSPVSAFWQQVIPLFEAESRMSFAKIDTYYPDWRTLFTMPQDEIMRWSNSNEILLSAIVRVSGVEMLVDSSKSWQRLYLLHRAAWPGIKVIHLVRDGRAVINSYNRKYSGPRHGLEKWAKISLMAPYLRRKFARSDWLQVKYEDLATEPIPILKGICHFLGVGFEPEMLQYRRALYVGLGGNRMAGYKDESISLEEGWKFELAVSHRLYFALLGGWLNKLYGY